MITYPKLIERDRDWSEYPVGTRAHAFNGGYWEKQSDGYWQWAGGSLFPTPGADAFGRCIELREAQKS